MAGRLAQGASVLITGAGGGVGSFAVQIAAAYGGKVTAATSTPKLELVRSLGADVVIDTSRVDLTRLGRRWDVIIDTAGRRPLRQVRRILAPRGTAVFVGGEGGGPILGGFDRHFRAMALSRFIGQDLKMLVNAELGSDLAVLDEMIRAEKLTPIVDRVFPSPGSPMRCATSSPVASRASSSSG